MTYSVELLWPGPEKTVVNIAIEPPKWVEGHAVCAIRGDIFPSDCQAIGADPLQAFELALRLASQLASAKGLTWPNGQEVCFDAGPPYPAEVLEFFSKNLSV